MNSENAIIIEFFGEGKTDIGPSSAPTPPTAGVVPILIHWGVRSAAQKDRVALAISDPHLLEERCPRGFGRFAQEIRQFISPLFSD